MPAPRQQACENQEGFGSVSPALVLDRFRFTNEFGSHTVPVSVLEMSVPTLAVPTNQFEGPS